MDWEKLAYHALERIKERTTLDPNIIPLLEAEADRISDQVPPGYYYAPINDNKGRLAAYAAFKTVPTYNGHRLVLATVLSATMVPKGTSLAHLIKMPTMKTASVFDVETADNPYQRVLRKRFNDIASSVRTDGAFAGTAHRRVLIPKNKLTERDINALGFTPVTIAIPEAGQDRFQSFRHPDNNFHIHSHPEGWTMHEDSHAAATMMAKKAKTPGEKAKAMVQGIPHVSEEGLPGLYYYLKGAIGGHKSTAQRVFKELPLNVKLRMYGMPSSPTANAETAIEAAKHAMVEKLASILHTIPFDETKLNPITRKLLEQSDVPVHFSEQALSGDPNDYAEGRNAYFSPRSDEPNKRKGMHITSDFADPNSIAHELGHRELHRNWYTRWLQTPPTGFGFLLAPLVGSTAGSIGGRLHRQGTPAHVAAAVSLLPSILASLPRTLAEVAATSKGRDLMQEAGATPHDLDQYDTDMRGALKTYLRYAGTGPLFGGVGHGLSYLMHKKSMELFGITEKTAEVLTELKPHQQRVVNRMADPNQTGLVAVHGLGSGKTLTSIAVADKLGLPADVVVPAALQGNYSKELEKHTNAPLDTNIQSLENVARKGDHLLTRPLLIVDEAHRLRNPGKTQRTLANSPADKRLLLTGSLFYNHPADMAAPINMAAGTKVLPSDPNEFAGRFVRERYVKPNLFGRITGKPGETVVEVNPFEKPYLQELLKKYVDYHPGSTEGFPTREEQTIKVDMSPEQRQIYDKVMEDAPPWVREKLLKNLPPTKSEAKQLNSFLTGVRQVSNSTSAYDIVNDPHEPKIDKAVEELKKMMETNPEAKAVIYSNFLPSGINPYKRRLDDLKIPYGEFTGKMNKSVRDKLVQDYNNNKLRALLLSSAGGEGLDLKGTNLIQLLEPHWNEEKLKQVIGRGIRFKSHDHLPEEQRKVLIQRFLSTRPRMGLMEKLKLKDPGGSVDEYLFSRSQEKENLNQQFRNLLN